MERLKKYLLVTLGLALAGAIGAAFGTGTAQAVVASLVQIANTTSNPAPSLNVTDPGRIPYQSAINTLGHCSGTTCTFAFPAVPVNHRVVVQHIGGFVSLTGGLPTFAGVQISSSQFGFVTEFYLPAGLQVSAFDQPVLLYADSSASISVLAFVSTSTAIAGGVLTLTGYELDCAVAACAPIATQ